MPTLYAYRKVTDAITTHILQAPFDAFKKTSQELCLLPDGRTVIALLNDYTLPADQPEAVKASIEHLQPPLSDDLKAQIIKDSPAFQLIASQLQDHIRAVYSQDDEAYLNRINIAQLAGKYSMTAKEIAMTEAFAARVEEARAKAKAARAELGLG